jgi:hypothetical protein
MPLIDYTYICEWEECRQVRTKRVRTKSQPFPRFCDHRCWYAYRAKYGEVTRKYTFTDAQNALIRKAHRKKNNLKALWKTGAFGEIPYAICKRQQYILGLIRSEPNQNWTDAEEAIVLEHAGKALETIVKKLKAQGYHRTPTAVRIRLWKLGMDGRQGDWTASQIAQGLDIDEHVVMTWVRRGFLKASHTAGPDRPHWYVTSKDLRRFLIEHPFMAAHGDMRLVWVITLLSGDATLDRAVMRD